MLQNHNHRLAIEKTQNEFVVREQDLVGRVEYASSLPPSSPPPTTLPLLIIKVTKQRC